MTELLEASHQVSPDSRPPEGTLRAQALERLNKKREFRVHVLVFTLVNAFLWLIWGVVYATTGVWFPWPVFPLFGWGIGLVLHAWDTYRRRPFSDSEIERELTLLRGGQ